MAVAFHRIQTTGCDIGVAIGFFAADSNQVLTTCRAFIPEDLDPQLLSA